MKLLKESMSEKVNSNLSVLYIILAGTLWGAMGLFVRSLGADGLSSIEIVFFRIVVSALIMLVWLLLFGKEALRIKIRDIWCFVGTGIISLTTFNVCYFATIQRTTMAIAAILLYTSPIFVVLLSAVFFKERITVVKFFALILAFFGCAFVTGVFTGAGEVMDAKGILIGIGAGVGYALYSIFGRYAIERGYSSVTISFYTFAFASAGMIIANPWIAPLNLTVAKIISGNTVKDILLIVGICIVSTIFPYLLYTKGLSGVENGKAGIMASTEPIVAAILGIIVFSEKLTADTAIGVVMVLAAIAVLNINFGSKGNDPADKASHK